MPAKPGLIADPRYRIYFTVQAGVFLTVVDMTSAYIAVPSIATEFGIGLPAAQWFLAGYLLTLATLLVPAGRLSDNFGRKNLFVGGFSLGAIGAFAAYFATGIEMLITARVVMGIGAATVQASSMPIIISAFDAKDRGKVLGGQMGIVGVGTVLGPVLGGLVIHEFGWRAAYIVISAVCVVIALLASRVLERRPDPVAEDYRRFDYLGAVLLALSMLFLLLVLTNAPRLGWTKPLVLLGIGAGLFSGAAFISWEQRCKHPLLDLNTFRSATYSLGLVVACIGFMGTSAAYYLIPFYLQFVSGLTPASIGLALVPAGVVTALVSPLAGHTGDRFGHRRVATLGVTLLVAGLTCLSTLSPQTSTFWVSAFMAVLAVGLASFHAPNSSAVFADLPPEVFGVTSGSINLARNLGNVTGIAIATAIVTGTMSSRGFEPKLAAVQESGDPVILTAFVDGMTTSFLAFAVLCACLIATTVWLKSSGRLSW